MVAPLHWVTRWAAQGPGVQPPYCMRCRNVASPPDLVWFPCALDLAWVQQQFLSVVVRLTSSEMHSPSSSRTTFHEMHSRSCLHSQGSAEGSLCVKCPVVSGCQEPVLICVLQALITPVVTNHTSTFRLCVLFALGVHFVCCVQFILFSQRSSSCV